MPVSPGDAEDLSRQAAELHEEAERSILGQVARVLSGGLSHPLWEQRRRDRAGALRRAIGAITARLGHRTRQWAAKAAGEAIERGQQAADDELSRVPGLGELPDRPEVDAAVAERSVTSGLRTLYDAIDDRTMSAYQRMVTRTVSLAEEGTITRLKAASTVLADLADSGVTGFVDRRGRNWELSTYVEMTTRTALANIQIDAHLERIQQLGVNLVYVSDAPYECEICRPWEGKILHVGGPEGRHTVRRGGSLFHRGTKVEVAGSLSEARAAGLFHPSCRHSLEAYIPGVTRLPTKPDTKGVTYEDTKKLRYLERQSRKWDRRAQVALTARDRADALRRMKQYRSRAKELTQQTGLPRKTYRERHGKAR